MFTLTHCELNVRSKRLRQWALSAILRSRWHITSTIALETIVKCIGALNYDENVFLYYSAGSRHEVTLYFLCKNMRII